MHKNNQINEFYNIKNWETSNNYTLLYVNSTTEQYTIWLLFIDYEINSMHLTVVFLTTDPYNISATTLVAK